MSKKRGVRDQARIVEPAAIPGGRLLAKHVAGIVVTYMKYEWEPVKAKIAKQKSLLDATGKPIEGSRHCSDCGFLGVKAEMTVCQLCWSYGCKSCWGENQVCLQHGTPCKGHPNCKRRVHATEGPHSKPQVCAACQLFICIEHSQFCSKCGKQLCLVGCGAVHKCEYAHKETSQIK